MTLNEIYTTSISELLKYCDISKLNVISNSVTGDVEKIILEYIPKDIKQEGEFKNVAEIRRQSFN